MPGEYWIPVLGREAQLRNDFLAYVDAEITKQNTLDAVSEEHTVEFQRGVVQGLRFLRNRVAEYTDKKE